MSFVIEFLVQHGEKEKWEPLAENIFKPKDSLFDAQQFIKKNQETLSGLSSKIRIVEKKVVCEVVL